MDVKKISLPTAYKIETVRSNGVSHEEMLEALEKGDVSAWEAYNENFDYTELVELYRNDPEGFQKMLENGYSVKFVTLPGVKNLLKLRFGFLEERDYELTEAGITGLQVDEKQYAAITKMLSKNWRVEVLSDDEKKVIKIEL